MQISKHLKQGPQQSGQRLLRTAILKCSSYISLKEDQKMNESITGKASLLRLAVLVAAIVCAVGPVAKAGMIVAWGATLDPPGGNDYVAIAAGDSHSLALKSDGSIVGWPDERSMPPGNDYIAIAAGWPYRLALKSDGSIVDWGSGQATPPGNDYVAIAAGSLHSLALKSDGSIVGWGYDDYGQATPPGKNYVAIAARRRSQRFSSRPVRSSRSRPEVRWLNRGLGRERFRSGHAARRQRLCCDSRRTVSQSRASL